MCWLHGRQAEINPVKDLQSCKRPPKLGRVLKVEKMWHSLLWEWEGKYSCMSLPWLKIDNLCTWNSDISLVLLWSRCSHPKIVQLRIMLCHVIQCRTQLWGNVLEQVTQIHHEKITLREMHWQPSMEFLLSQCGGMFWSSLIIASTYSCQWFEGLQIVCIGLLMHMTKVSLVNRLPGQCGSTMVITSLLRPWWMTSRKQS